jgi:hypothetical protein
MRRIPRPSTAKAAAFMAEAPLTLAEVTRAQCAAQARNLAEDPDMAWATVATAAINSADANNSFRGMIT